MLLILEMLLLWIGNVLVSGDGGYVVMLVKDVVVGNLVLGLGVSVLVGGL